MLWAPWGTKVEGGVGKWKVRKEVVPSYDGSRHFPTNKLTVWLGVNKVLNPTSISQGSKRNARADSLR